MSETTTTEDSSAAAAPDERALLRAARGGDVRAFEALYRMLAPGVYGLCLRLARNPAEAQDCTQDTFVRAWQRLADFRGESRLGTWLHRIAVNEVLGRRRHQAVEHRHLSSVDPSKRYSLDDSATFQDLEQAIARLPDRAREVFVLRAVYGYTHEEIGGMLQVTVSTSKTQHHRARKLLIGALPGLGGAAEDSDAAFDTASNGGDE